MSARRLAMIAVIAVLAAAAGGGRIAAAPRVGFPAAAAGEPSGPADGTAPSGAVPAPDAASPVNSLAGSNVVFDPTAGDGCYPGCVTPFCFRAETVTDDWEYVYNLWVKFPTSWTVHDAYLWDTPACTGGGTWGPFSWSFETSPYEVNISHPRYQAATDDCVATYCFDVTPGSPGDISWYYDGDGYGSAPHHPCSWDQYTPGSMSDQPCDEAVNLPADVPFCCAYLPPPCTTATVSIDPGHLQVAVDPATGRYGPVLLNAGNYTVEVSASGYSTKVVTVTIVDELTTTADVILDRPAAAVAPTAIAASAPPNSPVTVPITVSNWGLVPLEYQVLEIPDLTWVSVEPVSGTVPGWANQQVSVSNDPGTPLVAVALTLTVQRPPTIVVEPVTLEAELCAERTATLPITICNVGDVSLTWSLAENAGPGCPGGFPSSCAAPLGAGPAGLPASATPYAMVLDDGTRENDVGLGGTVEMIWVNRFTPPEDQFPFILVQVRVYFSALGLVDVGDDIVIVVYENTSGNVDPAAGSNFLASYPAQVQVLDGWSLYDLPIPLSLAGPGDVILGVIGMEVPGTSYSPAAIDQTTTQERSWVGWWYSSPPPNPPQLPPDEWTPVDPYYPGNWMVRGYGYPDGPGDIPWLSATPSGGTVAPDACAVVAVTLDSSGLAPAVYTGSLQISSDDPDTPELPIPVTLTVSNTAPSGANFVFAPSEPEVGTTVTFTGTVAGGSGVAYLWEFGDGMGPAMGPIVTHTFDAPGSFPVSVVASNGCGAAAATHTVTVTAAPCEGLVGVVVQGPAGLRVGEMGLYSATYAPLTATRPVSFAWNNGTAGPSAGYSWALPGNYAVVVTATNSCGAATARWVVAVHPYRIYLPLVVRGRPG